MLSRNNVAVVLVEPRYPGNIGSVARAMANTGFKELILVDPCPIDHPEARKMALCAYPIVEKAKVVGNLKEALDRFQFAVATTRREGPLRNESFDPRSLAEKLAGVLSGNLVALVFGPEDRGLSNEELALCNAVATIPTHPSFSSMNLSHAVMIMLWELWVRVENYEALPPARVLADVRKLEDMYRHMERVLLEIGYLHPENPQRMIRVLKKILNRAELDEREVRAIRGMFRQFDWHIKEKT